MAENFQWSNKNSNPGKKPSFRLMAVIGIVVVAIGLPATIILSQNQQQIRQFASIFPSWKINISANAVCPPSNGGTAVIKFSFQNIDTYTMTVTVKDLQTGNTASLGQVPAGQTKTGEINTGLTNLQSGQVQFLLSGNGSSDSSHKASYYAIKCTVPTPTPTNTPTPIPSNTPTPTQTPTPIPSSTPTPTPSKTPTPTPPNVPACQVNQAICKWSADGSAVTYHYKITDTTTGDVNEGDVNAPQTFVTFPTLTGHSYSCSVSGASACGVGSNGSATFVCPTPTSCPTPGTPPNVKISCPNCVK